MKDKKPVCPHCKEVVDVPAFVGHPFTCPHCGKNYSCTEVNIVRSFKLVKVN